MGNIKPTDMSVVDFICCIQSGLDCLSIRLGNTKDEEVECQQALVCLLDVIVHNPIIREIRTIDAFFHINRPCIEILEDQGLIYRLTGMQKRIVVYCAWLFLEHNYGKLFEDNDLDFDVITICNRIAWN